ncbi:MAG: hypothetical protein LJF04_03140, partial [Gemmatimonadetes bacterium]|nr:hypothetical protein [Gemmatimonadota bacterium]
MDLSHTRTRDDMSLVPSALLAAALAVAAHPAAAQDPAVPVAVSLEAKQEAAVLAKIDPPLLKVLESGDSARVIALGRTQLFEPVGGLERFENEHATEDRRTLRQDVVATLKRNAAADQAAILRALGRTRADRALWILNALSLKLSADEIRAASRLDEVLFI